MNLSFILTFLGLVWAMLSGWIGILGDIGIDGISSIAGLLGMSL